MKRTDPWRPPVSRLDYLRRRLAAIEHSPAPHEQEEAHRIRALLPPVDDQLVADLAAAVNDAPPFYASLLRRALGALR